MSAALAAGRASSRMLACAIASIGLGLLVVVVGRDVAQVDTSRLAGLALAVGTIAIAALMLLRAATASGRVGLLSGLGVTCFFFAWTFGLRPLYLLLANAGDSHFVSPHDAYDALSALESQEVILFFSTRGLNLVKSSIGALSLGLLFFVAFLGAYALRRSRQRVLEVGEGSPAHQWKRVFPTSWMLTMILVSFIAQADVARALGGVGNLADSLITQDALRLPFYDYIAISAGPIALCLFFATRQRLVGGERVLFAAGLVEATLFAGLTGSRSRAMVPLAVLLVLAHATRRTYSNRQIVFAFVAVVVTASAFLLLRQETQRATFSEAVSNVVARPPSVGVLLNDNSTFDSVAEAVALGPGYLRNRPGDRIGAGLAAAVPSVIYGPAKPPTTDVWFRQQIWGTRYLGGRPLTIVGELWLDFGIVGVLLGGALIGYAVASVDQALGRLRRDGKARTVWAALLVVLLWTLLGGGFSLFTGQLLLFGVPLIAGTVLLQLTGRSSVRP